MQPHLVDTQPLFRIVVHRAVTSHHKSSLVIPLTDDGSVDLNHLLGVSHGHRCVISTEAFQELMVVELLLLQEGLLFLLVAVRRQGAIFATLDSLKDEIFGCPHTQLCILS